MSAGGRFSRRDVLQAGAAGALGLYGLGGLAGCGIGRGIQGDVNRVIEPKVDGDLYYFNYSQYINPALVKGSPRRAAWCGSQMATGCPRRYPTTAAPVSG
jgi:hypothetical protein